MASRDCTKKKNLLYISKSLASSVSCRLHVNEFNRTELAEDGSHIRFRNTVMETSHIQSRRTCNSSDAELLLVTDKHVFFFFFTSPHLFSAHLSLLTALACSLLSLLSLLSCSLRSLLLLLYLRCDCLVFLGLRSLDHDRLAHKLCT